MPCLCFAELQTDDEVQCNGYENSCVVETFKQQGCTWV
jgi:hypothetical protein